MNEASQAWGLNVFRYEIRNIKPPTTVQAAMEKQVNAERERRAILARSEGDRQARINTSEGQKAEMINLSEGEMQKTINEAEGRAAEILSLALATSESIEKIGAAVSENEGDRAIRLDIAGKYISSLRHLSRDGTEIIFPADVTNLDGLLDGLGLSLNPGNV